MAVARVGRQIFEGRRTRAAGWQMCVCVSARRLGREGQPSTGDALELVLTMRSELQAGPGREIDDCTRHENLARGREVADAFRRTKRKN
jgi:hypothetical protein